MELNLGIRAHDINFHTEEEIADEVANKGLKAIQLALPKSFKQLSFEKGALTPGFAKRINKPFHNIQIDIAVLGCYINMIHPNQEDRRKALDRFKEHIRFARDFNCSIVGTETGNVHAKMGYTTDNFTEKPFLAVVDSVRELVREAEKFGVIVGIEGGVNHPVHTPELMKELVDRVDSNNLQVIYDPANYITVDNYKQQEKLFQTAVNLFGDRIVIIHAKDFIVESNQIKMVPVGKGILDYQQIFSWIKTNKPHIHVLLENTKEPYIDGSISYLKQIFEMSQ
ncbi:sugar phosphate isomerase/epimerase family protein [Paraliobacillus sediminis]|uniref:sugar phosphate isomerase/epimerase family protein n=1 Tax=Paraliobacillus sediminis TaxID=1885916 RepID=UPI000E3EB2EE|nr:sugar phosphate isomerase/epimerase [Paraliobacillus sediminis]